jgi:hypothetical protein
VKTALENSIQRLSRELNLKISIAECSLSLESNILFRNKRWILEGNNLYIRLIQIIYNSAISGYPGREITYMIVI